MNQITDNLHYVILAFVVLFFVKTQFALAKDGIDPKTANELVQNKKAVLIDVREQSEVAEGMASPAIWLPLGDIEKNSEVYQKTMNSIPKDKKVILYCRSGRRSAVALEHVKKLGYDVSNMGGFSGWESAGLPTKKGP